MKMDENECLISEIHKDSEAGGYAANRGDSMAETCRWIHLLKILFPDASIDMKTAQKFISETGYLRHPSPEMPDDWKESDSTSDQCLPFYLAVNDSMKQQMKLRLKFNGWKTGNGDLVSPIFYAILTGSQLKLDMCLLGQILIFKFPWRWNDGKRCIERSEHSSCDYLNFFHSLVLASEWVKKLVSRDNVMWKVCDYYAQEPNSDWIIDLYNKATKVVLK